LVHLSTLGVKMNMKSNPPKASAEQVVWAAAGIVDTDLSE
jgi:hypothetical protein